MAVPTISVTRNEKLIYGYYKHMDYTYVYYHRIWITHTVTITVWLYAISVYGIGIAYRVYAIYNKVEYYFKLPYSDLFCNYILYWQFNDREKKFKTFPIGIH